LLILHDILALYITTYIDVRPCKLLVISQKKIDEQEVIIILLNLCQTCATNKRPHGTTLNTYCMVMHCAGNHRIFMCSPYRVSLAIHARQTRESGAVVVATNIMSYLN
jgi:hypothetical protein